MCQTYWVMVENIGERGECNVAVVKLDDGLRSYVLSMGDMGHMGEDLLARNRTILEIKGRSMNGVTRGAPPRLPPDNRQATGPPVTLTLPAETARRTAASAGSHYHVATS